MRPEARVTRFAPSPTGPLHLGHAYAAIVAAERAGAGRFMLRIEDIDAPRCRPEYESAIFEDLRWLGLAWDEPVMRQSKRMDAYRAALAQLAALGVLYPCRCQRRDIRAALSAPQEGAPLHGPDGLIYPGTCRGRAMADAGPGDALRLDMERAMALTGSVAFTESGPERLGSYRADAGWMSAHIGDAVLARRDLGTSYHLSVVIDDAAQGVTEVTRGNDLFDATYLHVLLQKLLKLLPTSYYHHKLIRDEQGKRLAKRDDARAIALFRSDGVSPQALKARLMAQSGT